MILLSNTNDELMYDELYHYKEWYSYSFDLVEFKLKNGFNFNIKKAINFFERKFNIYIEHQRKDIESFLLRTTPNNYTIYINDLTVYRLFLNEILLHPYFEISITTITPRVVSKKVKIYIEKINKLFYDINKWCENNKTEFDSFEYPYHRSEDNCYISELKITSINEDFIKNLRSKYENAIIKYNEDALKNDDDTWRKMYHKNFIVMVDCCSN